MLRFVFARQVKISLLKLLYKNNLQGFLVMLTRLKWSMLFFCFIPFGHTFEQGWSDFAVGLGNFTHQAGKIATDIGKTSLIEFRPVLAASYRYEMTPEWSFIPEAGVTLPETSDDETHTTIYAFVNAPLAWHYGSWSFRGGPGFFFTRISGKGGTLTLQNGTSSDAFPVPSGSATTRNITFNFGTQYALDREWSVRFDMAILKLLDSEKRAVNHVLTFNYHFGAIL